MTQSTRRLSAAVILAVLPSLLFAVPPAAGTGGEAEVTVVGVRQAGILIAYAFVPPVLVIDAGTTVVWKNPTLVLHTIATTVSTTGGAFDEPLRGLGDCRDANGTVVPCEFRMRYDEQGVVHYQCKQHLSTHGMQGVILVK